MSFQSTSEIAARYKALRRVQAKGDTSNAIAFSTSYVKKSKSTYLIIYIGAFIAKEMGVMPKDKIDLLFDSEDHLALIKRVGSSDPGIIMLPVAKNKEGRLSGRLRLNPGFPFPKKMYRVLSEDITRDNGDLMFDTPKCAFALYEDPEPKEERENDD